MTGDELRQLLDDFQQVAFSITVLDRNGRAGLRPAETIVDLALEDMRERHKSGKPTGVTTPFTQLNQATGGFQRGELVIVAGRPSQGKTAMLLDFAEHATNQVPTCFFSLEMDALQIGQRLISKQACVNLRSVRADRFDSATLDQIAAVLKRSRKAQLFVDDSADVSVLNIRARVRELGQRLGRPVGLVCIDYLQLIRPARQSDSREREVASISRALKTMAKDLAVPVVVASQLNRALESRKDKRPILADLRESGAQEQDADIVLAPYLPSVYSGEESDRGKAECILLKQRNGPIGSMPLRWRPTIATFANPDDSIETPHRTVRSPADCPECVKSRDGWCHEAGKRIVDLHECPLAGQR